jgi:hypothetical protein
VNPLVYVGFPDFDTTAGYSMIKIIKTHSPLNLVGAREQRKINYLIPL